MAAGLLVSGIAIAATGIGRLMAAVEDMPRVVMPGKAEIVLTVGDTTLYAESQSIVGGKAYVVDGELDFRCGIADGAGKPVPIESPTSRVSYSMGGYQGRNAFDVHVEIAGTYVLECEAPRPFTLAIGTGIGTGIVVALVGGLVPAGLAVLMFVIVLVKRSRQKRSLRARAP